MFDWHDHSIGMWILMVAYWGFIVAVIGYAGHLIGRAIGSHRDAPSQDRPESILAERFARGDISEEEFRERRAALRT